MPPPMAYFLTWTTHGTWLHGDERGSVDRHNRGVGTPTAMPEAERARLERDRAAGPAVILSDEARAIVERVICRHCEIRGWSLAACNVRTNHVHVVVGRCGEYLPEEVMSQFKAWSTRRLREAGLAGADARVWTEHGSTRWINDEESLGRAVDYVLNRQ